MGHLAWPRWLHLARRPGTRRCLSCAVSWMPCSTCCARDAGGVPCRRASRLGRAWSASAPSSDPQCGAVGAFGSGSGPACASSTAWPTAARPSLRPPSLREGACRTSTALERQRRSSVRPTPCAPPGRAARAGEPALGPAQPAVTRSACYVTLRRGKSVNWGCVGDQLAVQNV